MLMITSSPRARLGELCDQRVTVVVPPPDHAESGAGDEIIRDIAGHVSKQMLKHYSHIRMGAKRRALEAIVTDKSEKRVDRFETPQADNATYSSESLSDYRN